MSEAVRQLSPGAFPSLLAEMPDAPDTLYCRGELPDPTYYTYLSVVGTRAHTAYGKAACESILHGLAGAPITIVSGLALGIDGIAHTAAIEAGIPTVAIPGSGISDTAIYPATHRGLAQRILESNGALLSEFTPDTKARPEYFPQRNRIMAGISHATLVIEAAQKSGTLITARLAADYNRDVLAVPGSAFSEKSNGANMLIKKGAGVITCAQDVYDALQIPNDASEIDNRSFSAEEKQVYDLLAEPCSRDTLIAKLTLPTPVANSLISQMELRGLINVHNGLLYRT